MRASSNPNHHGGQRAERDDVEREHGTNRCAHSNPLTIGLTTRPPSDAVVSRPNPAPGARRNHRRRRGIGSGHPATNRNPEDRRRHERPPDIMHQDVDPAPPPPRRMRRQSIEEEAGVEGCGAVGTAERPGPGRERKQQAGDERDCAGNVRARRYTEEESARSSDRRTAGRRSPPS